MGGQTALNTALALAESGALERHGVELIGANREAIAKAEDRLQFREAMSRIGLESPKSALVGSLKEAQDALAAIGLPVIIRPSYTLGGTGGGVAYNREELRHLRPRPARLAGQPGLIEESVLAGRVPRGRCPRQGGQRIIVCSIENGDPMGLPPRQHHGRAGAHCPTRIPDDGKRLDCSVARDRRRSGGPTCSRRRAGGRPEVIIEMNPRVSRSSALASKATGFPIAKVAARLAVGYTLDEIRNDITGVTPASFEPTIDYVVTKMPRFTFEKFAGAEPVLTTAMKSVGEAMAIGRTFAESLQKACRSMETGLTGLDPIDIQDGADTMIARLAEPTPDRLLSSPRPCARFRRRTRSQACRSILVPRRTANRRGRTADRSRCLLGGSDASPA